MAHTAMHPSFNELVDAHAPVIQLGTGFTFTEGPLWNPVDREVLFSDMPADVRRRWTPDGRVTEIARPSNKGNGLTFDADLNLLVCEHATSSVARIGKDGGREVLCSHFQGRELNSPNDICVRSDGAVYFTDPTYGRMEHFGVPRPAQMGFQGVYRLPPGHRAGDEPQLVVDRYTFTQPNGLCFSPCEQFMWVNDTDQANVRFYDVSGDGSLVNPRMFASGIRDSRLPGLPDGMKSDRNGNVFVTGPGGVWVYSFQGTLIGQIEVPEQTANIHWGDDDWSTLYICATSSLYALKTKTQGRIEPFMHARGVAAASGPANAAGGLRISPQRTALIIQDMQQDVILDGGAFADSGAPAHAKAQNVVENSRRLAEVCRTHGILVIHVWFICEPGHPALTRNAPLFEGVRSANALVRGSWGAAPAPGLEAREGDLIVEKMTMSAWESSRLESYLRGAGIDTLINTGAWTNMSVEHTARTAADKGFRVIVPEDACSTMNAEWHRASTEFAMQNVATVTRCEDIIRTLGG